MLLLTCFEKKSEYGWVKVGFEQSQLSEQFLLQHIDLLKQISNKMQQEGFLEFPRVYFSPQLTGSASPDHMQHLTLCVERSVSPPSILRGLGTVVHNLRILERDIAINHYVLLTFVFLF